MSGADEYLNKFVKLFGTLYGKEFLSSNIHTLGHLAKDVKNMNCTLQELSAFEFESYLGLLKKKLSSGFKPLTQICNRLDEFSMDTRKNESLTNLLLQF